MLLRFLCNFSAIGKRFAVLELSADLRVPHGDEMRISGFDERGRAPAPCRADLASATEHPQSNSSIT
jgi:hypothetical protein